MDCMMIQVAGFGFYQFRQTRRGWTQSQRSSGQLYHRSGKTDLVPTRRELVLMDRVGAPVLTSQVSDRHMVS